jgi:hypothetical protein
MGDSMMSGADAGAVLKGGANDSCAGFGCKRGLNFRCCMQIVLIVTMAATIWIMPFMDYWDNVISIVSMGGI